MANDMTSSPPLVDERGAAFGRFASRVIETLNAAIEHRRAQGESVSTIADQLGCHRSVISRVLNGTTKNPTLRTVSDILWAARFEPEDFRADPIESIAPNWVAEPNVRVENESRAFVLYGTKTVYFDKEFADLNINTVFRKPEIEMSVR
jgi:hypothetical protein